MPDPMSHLTPVVLAGGSGTRFWPLSRELSPKQMLTVFGGTSLVKQAIARVGRFAQPGRTIVLTSELLAPELRDHLAGDATAVRVLAEPSARNTAPAVALAAAFALREDADAIIAMVPSDHLLADGAAWESALRDAAHAAADGWIVTLGLVPGAPETGYGYIRPGAAIPGKSDVLKVESFLEKPDAATAQALIAGGCLWNSGMLVARADVILSELAAAGDRGATEDSSHGRAIADAVAALSALAPDEWLLSPARDTYDALPAVQFDRAVLEVSDHVAVVPTELDWSDVGSLLALDRLDHADADGNVLIGRVTDVGSRGVTAYAPERLVATLGLEDILVVDTADATLVAAKERAQDVRLIVDALKASGAAEVTHSRTALRPWGRWTLLLKGEGFQVKTIEVQPGRRLSLQSHKRRSEHWIVVEGKARVEVDGQTLEAAPGHSVDIPVGAVHRLAAVGDTPLRIIEIALGDYLGEDDIERFADDWQRTGR